MHAQGSLLSLPVPLYNQFVQPKPKVQKLLPSFTVRNLFAALASKLERTLASPRCYRLNCAVFSKPIWQTIRCSIQSFFEISDRQYNALNDTALQNTIEAEKLKLCSLFFYSFACSSTKPLIEFSILIDWI